MPISLFTPAERSRAVQRTLHGESVKAVAQELGISPNLLAAWRRLDPAVYPKKVHVRERRQRAFRAFLFEGKTTAQIARELKVSESTVTFDLHSMNLRRRYNKSAERGEAGDG